MISEWKEEGNGVMENCQTLSIHKTQTTVPNAKSTFYETSALALIRKYWKDKYIFLFVHNIGEIFFTNLKVFVIGKFNVQKTVAWR